MTELEMDRYAAERLLTACQQLARRNSSEEGVEYFGACLEASKIHPQPWQEARRNFWDGTRGWQRWDIETALNSAEEQAADESEEGKHAIRLIVRLANAALPREEESERD